MPVASMTGFARTEGIAEDTDFVWELRSVNGKGLEIRLRLPQGYEAVENDIRTLAGARLSRGNIQISLSLRKSSDAPVFTVNEAMLRQVLVLTERLIAGGHAVTPTADGLLAIKGIIDVAETVVDPERDSARRTSVLSDFGKALEQLVTAREREGAVLRGLLDRRLDEIEQLAKAAEHDPARTPEAIRRRLADQVELLMGTGARLDEARLHQEVAIIATKADIREELDRLAAHVEAARALLAAGGPVGRRLDFLSQEFNRESNTLCSKSNATSLTAIGVELKVVIDQFREQVQNIE